MKNKILLLTAMLIGVFTLVNCDKFMSKSNSAPAESAKKMLKPEDISLDKPLGVEQILPSVTDAPNVWLGKEVAVRGKAHGISNVRDGATISLSSEDPATSGYIACWVAGAVDSNEFLGKTLAVKGKVKKLAINDKTRSFDLDPCELKK